jgi:hypothetical protein
MTVERAEVARTEEPPVESAGERPKFKLNEIFSTESVEQKLHKVTPGTMSARDETGPINYTGSEIYPTAPGTEITVRHDNKRGYTKVMGDDANTYYFGPRTGETFQLRQEVGQPPRITDSDTGTQLQWSDDPQVRQVREKLMESAKTKFTDHAEQARFIANMAQLENRAGRDNLTPAQIVATYEQIGRLMNPQGRTAVAPEQTNRLAQQAMAQAGIPTNIDQGAYNTCNVTVIESMLYTKQPETATRMLADIAIKGETVAKDGTRVKLDASSLRPHGSAAENPPEDGQRSFATQLMNVALTNVHYAASDRNVRYEQHHPQRESDNGERLIDYGKRPPARVKDEEGKNVDFPNLDDNHILDIYRRVSGDNNPEAYLVNATGADATSSNTAQFDSAQDLGQRLERLQRDGKLPIILAVNTMLEPFRTDTGGDQDENENSGAHVVTVRGYDAGPPPKVQIDNQYGRNGDHLQGREMTLDRLYEATLPTAMGRDQLEQRLQQQRQNGTATTFDELDLLRLQRFTNQITHNEYNDAVVRQIQQASQNWTQQRANGTFNEQEFDRTRAKIGDTISSMNGAGMLRAFGALNGTNILDNESYAEGVRLALEGPFERRDKLRQEKKEYTPEERTAFSQSVREMGNLLQQLTPEMRVLAFKNMEDETVKRVLGNLQNSQQAERIRRELRAAGRRL